MEPPELPPIQMEGSPRRSVTELMALLSSADSVSDPAERDAALVEALRTIRKELDAAERESEAAKNRLVNAQDAYNMAADYLAGGEPADPTIEETAAAAVAATAAAVSNASFATTTYVKTPAREVRTKTAHKDESPDGPLPDNPIVMPGTYSSGGGMTEELVRVHRERFYEQLLGIPASEVENYVPSDKQPNLRSKAQLVEGMHIVENWYTGADGLDVGAFRSKYKTWYTRMKPNSSNLGRRTGIHVRALAPTSQSEGGETVLCRYNKRGDKSIVYLDVGSVYDALFEIHAVEYPHLGRDAIKARVDELYANIPDGQVKLFVETCPLCMGKKAEDGKISIV